jgi:hypothetical protein
MRRESNFSSKVSLPSDARHQTPINADPSQGIAYQLTREDPLVDAAQCELDASLMREVGANAIRVYHVDPDSDHTGCMSAFADVGIYLFVDLDDFPTQIEQVSSWRVQIAECE